MAKPGTVEENPWGHPVFKVAGKMFASADEDWISLKQTPERQSLLIQDPAIEVSPYVGRFGWIMVTVRDANTLAMAIDLIDEAYDQVVQKLPKKIRGQLL